MAVHQVSYLLSRPETETASLKLYPKPGMQDSKTYNRQATYFYVQASRPTVDFIDHVRIQRVPNQDPSQALPRLVRSKNVSSNSVWINGQRIFPTLMFDGLGGGDTPICQVQNYNGTNTFFQYDIGSNNEQDLRNGQKKLMAISDDQQYCLIAAYLPQQIRQQGGTLYISLPEQSANAVHFTLIVNYIDLFQSSLLSVFPVKSVYFGEKVSVQISNEYDVNFDIANNMYRSTFQYLKHDVYLRVKDHSDFHMEQIGTINKLLDFEIPYEWGYSIPDAQSCDVEVELITWEKTDPTEPDSSTAATNWQWQIVGQSRRTAFSIRIPDTAVPTCAGFTATLIQPPQLEGYADYLQKQSGVRLDVLDPAGAMGSTIVKYVFTDGIETIETTQPYCIIDKVSNSGAIEYSVVIYDSRGRTTKEKLTINVLSYEPPRLLSFATLRCNQNGESNPAGMYAAIRAKGQIDDLGGKNIMRMTYSYESVIKADPSDVRSEQYDLQDDSYMIIGGSFDPNKTYYVYFRVYDNFNYYEQRSLLQTQQYTMFFKPNGDVCAFGQIADPNTSQCIELSESWTISRGNKDYLKTLNDIERRVEEEEHNRGIEYGNG